METSLKAAEVLVPPQPDEAPSTLDPEGAEGEAAPAVAAAASPSSPSPSNAFDAMEEFGRRLEDIIHTYGPAAGLLDQQSEVEAEMEKMKEDAKGDITVAMDTDSALILQSLNTLSSPEEKLEDLLRKYAELAAWRRRDEQTTGALRQRLSVLMEERQRLQAERRGSVAARGELETLCRELQSYYGELREETLRRCREDEEKRTEITSHFQSMLTEIQTQIEQHSARNDKLCRENANLTDKLESLMTQCELREQSLDKINRHRDLQHKLTEAKLQQANALLVEAEEKHKREKEYLLVQAAEWKLQAQTLREQGTVMQAQLTLYAQKFDEFQATLAKSNEIYVRFKKEMDNMSDKMKKVEKESTVWKTRFENCNKALTDMIEERSEKGKEYDLFVLKIQKLEKLCRALQDERKVLYEKIKEVRRSNADLPSKFFGSLNLDADADPEGADKPALLTPDEVQELQEEDPVLTEDMSRLREEQVKLQEFAAALLATPADDEEEENEEVDLEEDVVASAFVHFKTKPQDLVPVPDVKPEAPESDLPGEGEEDEEVQNPAVVTPEAPTPEGSTVHPEPEPEVQTQVEVTEVQQVQPEEEIQQPAAPVPTPEPEDAELDPPTDPEEAKDEVLEETGEVKPVIPVDDEEAQQQEPSPGSAHVDSSKKQAPKKKKKKSGKTDACSWFSSDSASGRTN